MPRVTCHRSLANFQRSAKLPTPLKTVANMSPRPAPRIAHPNRSPPSSNQGSGLELSQTQGVIIQLPTGLGVSGLQNLKSAIQTESVNQVRTHSTADVVLCFQHQSIDSVLQ